MKIAVVGGGIGGLCAAVALQKQEYNVQVYESAPAFHSVGAGIGIGSNAMKALMDIGIGEEIFANGHVLHSLVFQNHKGKTLNTTDFLALTNKFGHHNITIHRTDLHRTLLEALLPGTIHYGKKCVSINQDNGAATVLFSDNSQTKADLVIAADGIHSPIRKQLLPKSKPRYAGYTCWRGITDNLDRLEEFTSEELWSTKGRFGMAPMANGKIYWFACINSPERNSQYQNLSPNEISHLFAHFPVTIPDVITSTPSRNILHHDILDIKPLRRFVYGKIVLLGDAAHATTPNMGQGAGQAIEDALVLANGFKQFKTTKQALAFYEKKRVARTAKVIRLSRYIGAAAQISIPSFAAFRDFLFPLIPTKLLQWRLKFLYDVDLN